MKVALACDSLIQYGGAEKVLKVLADIFPEAPIYTSIYNKEIFQSIFPHNRIQTSDLQKKADFFIKRYKLLLPKLPVVFEKFDFSEYDVVISSSSSFAKGIITSIDTLHINYCHTPTRFLWDSFHDYFKNQRLPFFIKPFVRNMLHKIRLWDFAASERVDFFIANSRNTAWRIKKYYRKESRVIYPPIDVKNYKVKKSNADYFLVVSRLEKYKQVDLIVKAFNQLPDRKLIIIGDGRQRKNLERIAEKNIKFLGYKPEEVVREYYENARIVICPSRDEDFGMTAVEAMACGKPVLALEQGGYKESVIPGMTGEFFHENTPKSFLEGLARILEKEEGFDSDVIREHALAFDISVFKEKILALLEEKVGKK